MSVNIILNLIIMAVISFIALSLFSRLLKIGFSILKIKIMIAVSAIIAPIFTAILNKADAIINFIN